MKTRKRLRRIPKKTRRRTRRRILKGGQIVLEGGKAILKKDSILYRVSKPDDTKIRRSNSTGKEGKYYATYPALSLGIAVESKGEKNVLGVFKVTEDIPLTSLHKYDPGSHIDRDVSMLDENGQALIQDITSIPDGFVKYMFMYRALQKNWDGEVFLTEDQLPLVELQAQYSVKDWEALKKHIQTHFSYEDLANLSGFVSTGLITPIAGGRRRSTRRR